MLDRSDPGAGGRSGVRRSPIVRVMVSPGGHAMTFKAWAMASEVKQRLQQSTGCRFAWMRLFHGPTEVQNTQRLLELLERRRHSRHSRMSPLTSSHQRTLKLTLKIQNPRDLSGGTYVAPWGGVDPSTIGRAGEKLLARIGQGIGQGFAPALALDGMGGTYVLRDAKRRPVAAFKPRDEEPFAPNNPRGLAGKMGQPGIHPAIPSGESHLREVIAYTLDHHGFSAVPPTLQAEALHPAFHVQSMRPLSRYGAKVGSLQAWVSHADLASDMGTATFPAHEVHKLAILDMRLLNTDRNDGNVLVTRTERTPPSSPVVGPAASPAANAAVACQAATPASAHSASSAAMGERRSGERRSGERRSGERTSGDAAQAERLSERLSERSSAADAAEEVEMLHVSPGGKRDGKGGGEGGEGGEGGGGGGFLVPIDHGGVLPTRPEVVWYNWCWLSWPQMVLPLGAETVEFIGRLDAIADARAIVDAGLPPSCARVCRCATRVLQRGVVSGLTLLDVAHMLARQEEDTPSDLERLWGQAERLAHSAVRNHRLRGLGPPPELPSSHDADGDSFGAKLYSPASIKRSVSYGSVADVSAADAAELPAAAAADALREPTGSGRPVAPPPERASSGLSRSVAVMIQPPKSADDADDEAAPPEGAPSNLPLPTEISPSNLPLPPESARSNLPLPPEGAPTGEVAQLPTDAKSPGLSRRTTFKLHRRVASFSTLVDMEATANADDAPGAERVSSIGLMGRAASGLAMSCEWDEELALDALFFTYFERLLEDAIKRVATRKRARAADVEREQQQQPPPQHQKQEQPPQQLLAPLPASQSAPPSPTARENQQEQWPPPQRQQMASAGGGGKQAPQREDQEEQQQPPPASPLLSRRLVLSTTRSNWADSVSEADEDEADEGEGQTTQRLWARGWSKAPPRLVGGFDDDMDNLVEFGSANLDGESCAQLDGCARADREGEDCEGCRKGKLIDAESVGL